MDFRVFQLSSRVFRNFCLPCRILIIFLGDFCDARLSAKQTRTLQLDEDVLCVRYSPEQKLLAVSLLDCTVKIFYVDTLKVQWPCLVMVLPFWLAWGRDQKEETLTVPGRSIFLKICMQIKHRCTRKARVLKESFGI